MKWFIPGAKDDDEATQIYEFTKERLERQGARFVDRRIRRITYYYRKDGKTHDAEVGKKLSRNSEEVFVILYEQQRNCYHICTPNRGVIQDMAILVGGDDVKSSEDFDEE